MLPDPIVRRKSGKAWSSIPWRWNIGTPPYAPAAADPALLDQLLALGDILPSLPPALRARLFAAFDIEIMWNKPGAQATVFAEITENTLQSIPAILNPGQDGYHDTRTPTSNDDTAPMGDLNNTHRLGRAPLSLIPEWRGAVPGVPVGRFAWCGTEVICLRAMNTRPRQQILTMIAIALTFGSGATDVASFTRLGGVFTSVMTGNIVLWGLSAAERSLSLASHTVVSIAGYIVGVAGGTWIAHGFKAASQGKADDEGTRASVLPGHVNWALFAELILLGGLTVGWEITGADPAGWAQFCLLAVTAAAMGVQASAVTEMGLSHVSTTFLTGTLTGLVSSLASPGKQTQHGVRRFGVLIGLAAGAGLSGLLVATAVEVVPALPLAALVTTLALAFVPLENGR